MVELRRGVSAPRWSVRTRILATMLLLAALGMLIAGGTTFLIQRERTLQELDERLIASVESARIVVEGAPLAEVGEGEVAAARSQSSVRDALRAVIATAVPAHDESSIGLVDGKATFVPGIEVDLPLENETAFLERVVGETSDGSVRMGSLDLGGTGYRYIAAPVTIEGDPEQGLFVMTLNVDEELGELETSFTTFAIVATLSLLAIGIVAWFVAGTLLRPIRSLRQAASRITASDRRERIPVQGHDDVSDLTETVNDMLDRLDSAMTSQHRLLDDVRHELKTPVTIIRGHLELLNPERADDVAATRDLAIDELDRMTDLIDDIDTWATVQASRIEPQPVDVATFTRSVFAKASALPAHTWELDGVASGSVQLDPQRITQAWLQLVDNAAKYSPTGSTVRLGSRIAHGAIELWVADAGPGIPAGSEERIFERFGRIDEGRGIRGSGLGLPIVRAIAEAHGGRVSLESDSSGSRFAIVIPLSDAAAATTLVLTRPLPTYTENGQS